MWPTLFTSFFTVAIFISDAYAHGTIANFTVDGKQYKGIAPWEGDSPSPNSGPIRQVATNGPVKDLKSADIACGLDAQFAGGVADAKPGSALVFEWGNIGDNDDTWPHNVGPIMTYMALCKGSCTKFNGTDAQWFKIDQLGQKKDGTWYQADLMAGKPITLSLPNDLPSGDYLLRHEIIALHLAESVGGAEFYPNCIQMRVAGDGSSTKQPDNIASFPGAYNADNPGIRVNVYNNPEDLKYVFPGPRLSVFAVTIDMASTEGGQAPSGALQAGAMPSPSAFADDSTSNFGTPTSQSPETTSLDSNAGDDSCSDSFSSNDSEPSSTPTEDPAGDSTSSDDDPNAGPTDEPCSSEAPSSIDGGSSAASETDALLTTSSPTSTATQTATEDTDVVTTVVTMTVIVTPLPILPPTSMPSSDDSNASTAPSEIAPTSSPSDVSITSTAGAVSSQSTALSPVTTSPSAPVPNFALDQPPSAITTPFTTLSSNTNASPRPMAMRKHRRRHDASRSRWNARRWPGRQRPAPIRAPRALGMEQIA